jgi:hypothetical protein
MAKKNPHQDRLMELEREIEEAMATRQRTGVPLKEIPSEVFVEFLVAYGLEQSLELTVGRGPELASSCLTPEQLSELSAFRLRNIDTAVRSNVINLMASRFGLREDEVAAIHLKIRHARLKLDTRRSVVSALRQTLFGEQIPDHASAKRAFDRMYPGNPLREHEVGIVLTATALYWRLPPAKALADSRRSTEDLELATQFIERLTGFRTSNFRQFPAFHGYDVRQSDPSLIDAVSKLVSLDYVDACDMIKRSVWIEATADIRLYIIHDTWGHVWQGDFSSLGELYDAAHFAFVPFTRTLPKKVAGRMITKADLLGGGSSKDPSVDDNLLSWMLRHRIHQLCHLVVTPITAELMADIAEYKFCIDGALSNPPIATLPSSSLFGYHPAKMDFGWISPYFFGGKFCDAMKMGLIELKGKEDALSFVASCGLPLDGLSLERLNTYPEQYSVWEHLLVQVIRIFATVNHCYGKQDQGCRHDLSSNGALLMMAMARIFCSDPRRLFWSLDRHVAESIPSLIRLALELEQPIQDPKAI